MERKERITISDTILFQKYRVLSPLGSGSSSSVYLAEHMKLKQYRAIKCIPKAQAPVTSIYLEADLLKNLRHPGIPIVYDIEEDESNLYIIEEYIQGESLSAFVQSQDNISQETVIAYGIQLCGIIEYLHSQQPLPVLYLDFKPEHIIVCDERLKLIDFGIAVVGGQAGNDFQSYGTRGFAAPELYQGSGACTKTDIFGIGAILYYMLNRKKLPQQMRHSLPHLKYCSPFLKKLVIKALSPLDERYESVTQLRQELEKLQERNLKPRSLWRQRAGQYKVFLHRREEMSRQHLLEKITIVGSQKHIGATHVAISLVSWLNHQKRKCMYQARDGGNLIPELVRWQEGVQWERDICSYRNFKGQCQEPRTGAAMPYITVEDHGDHIQQVAEELSDLVILVLGGRPWEYAAGLLAYQQLSGEENLVLLCNNGTPQTAARYARVFGRRVYCYPVEKDPFLSSKPKERLFETVIKEGGG